MGLGHYHTARKQARDGASAFLFPGPWIGSMRRLYESSAVSRDDEDPFVPGSRDRETEPQAMQSVPGNKLSRLLVPNWVRHRAISLDVSTPKGSYEAGEPVPFVVEMKNSFPIPIEIPTLSPVLWEWAIDGHPNASRVAPADPGDDGRGFRFDRGERKRFVKEWDQMFRVSNSEWEPARAGEHTISASLNVEDAEQKGVYGETTVRIE